MPQLLEGEKMHLRRRTFRRKKLFMERLASDASAEGKVTGTRKIDGHAGTGLPPEKPPEVISSSKTSEKPLPAFSFASRPSMN